MAYVCFANVLYSTSLYNEAFTSHCYKLQYVLIVQMYTHTMTINRTRSVNLTTVFVLLIFSTVHARSLPNLHR